MPNIANYNAPPATISPSSAGSSAWTQAGRRLGPLANEAAQFTREAGKLAADNKAQLWPFDILELYQRQAEAAAKGRGGGGVKIRPSRDQGTDAAGFDNPVMPDLAAANGQISQGSAALGRALADGGQAVSQRQPRGQQDPRQQDPRQQPGAPTEPMTLDQGELVTASAARKAMAKYNGDIEQGMEKYQQDLQNYGQGDPTIYRTARDANNQPVYPAGNPAPPRVGGLFTNEQTGGWAWPWNSGVGGSYSSSGGAVDTGDE